MSPTVFIENSYRFFFFSREERRIHIHVTAPGGEAKFWIEPIIALAENNGLSSKELNKIQTIIEARKDEIENKWKKHFKTS